jgi:zinc/manganese transport system permease protein
VNVLFGSIFGLSHSQSWTDSVVALGVVAAQIAIARPLLFSSLDASVAAARGVPVRAIGFVFLGLVGVTAAAATQAVGALLLLGLIAAPAGTAQRLIARPFRALCLSAGLAVVAMWGGLTVAYAAPSVPPSFAILAIATGCYVMAYLWTAGRRRRAVWAPGR